MATPAGWFNDPYGRFELRYWDGDAWTEHVSTQGTQAVDPLGDTTVIPIATPASAFEAPTAATFAASPGTANTAASTGESAPSGGSAVRRFLDGLGPDAKVRPAPRLSIALAGAGGALVAIGLSAAIIGDSFTRGATIGAGIIIVAAAVAARLFVKGQPDLASAAVGAGVVGLMALGAGIVLEDVGEAWGLLIIALLFLAAWVLPGLRGRPIMLGIGALLLVAALASATGDDSSGGVFGEVPFSDVVGDQEIVFLLAAAALFGLVWWLDEAGYRGVGTSLVVAALISAFVGVAQATGNLDDTGAATLIFAVGLLVCFVGSHGDRRATTWWGALLATIGLVGFFGSVMTPDSVSSTAAMFLISGVLLIVAPAVVRHLRSSKDAPDSAS